MRVDIFKINGTMSAKPASPESDRRSISEGHLHEWVATLQRYMATRTSCGVTADLLLAELRLASTHLVRAAPGSGWCALKDKTQSVADSVISWLRQLREDPVEAVVTLGREMRAVPRLVPSSIFLAVNALLFLWIFWQALGQIEGVWGVMALAASILTFLWATDALTYAVHLESIMPEIFNALLSTFLKEKAKV